MTERKTASQYITRQDSAALYGVAILLMIFHHCFCIPERLNYDYVPVLGGFELESRLAWIGKLCVAIYAFISGYALASASMGRGEEAILGRLKGSTKTSVRQAVRFYGKFWLVFALFVPVGIAFFGYSSAPGDLVRGLLFGWGYCGEWWYVSQYLKFLLVYPLVDVLVCRPLLVRDEARRRRAIASSAAFALAGVAAVLLVRAFAWQTVLGDVVRFVVNGYYTHFHSHYMVIFVLAFCIRACGVFERMSSRRCVPVGLLAAWLALVAVARWAYVTEAAQSDCDPLLIAPLMFSLVGLLHRMGAGRLYAALAFLGRYSTFMWLTHTFWIYYYFQRVILVTRLSVLIFAWAVCVAVANAMALEWLHGRLAGRRTDAARDSRGTWMRAVGTEKTIEHLRSGRIPERRYRPRQ